MENVLDTPDGIKPLDLDVVLVCSQQPSLGLVSEILSTRVIVQHRSPILALIFKKGQLCQALLCNSLAPVRPVHTKMMKHNEECSGLLFLQLLFPQTWGQLGRPPSPS